jgi:adenine/guanine phosphoribosyltransferase-like PRPP-binding protein
MMNSSELRKFLETLNALHTGKHFVYTSDTHGDAYADLRVFNREENKGHLGTLSLQLIEKILTTVEIDLDKPITIVGPDTLGAIIAEYAAYGHYAKYSRELRWLRLEAVVTNGEKEFRWHKDFVPARPHEQVIYVDDLMNESSTWKKCRPIVEKYGNVCAIGTIADRSGLIAHDLGVPYFISLVRFTLERFKPEDCPHCKNQVPIVLKPGHGHKFQADNPDYAGGYITL